MSYTWGTPRKAKAQQNCEAWFYYDHRGIQVYVRTVPNGPTVVCEISKRQLKSYLARAEAKP